jgi:hypothetical protein
MAMKSLLKLGMGAVVAAGAIAATSSAALADVACNKWGECWHVGERYTTYPGDIGVQFYSDTDWPAWKAHHHVKHWYEDRADDHGYWSHGKWVAFPQ